MLVIDEGTRVPVTSAMVLGRNPRKEAGVTVITVPDLDRELSKEHLGLTQNNKGIVSVIDLASTNGTVVNGKELPPRTPRVLEVGEVVLAGGHRFRIESRSLRNCAEAQ